MPRKPYDENAFIVESRQVKNVVRVTAVDPQTGIEATVVTPLRVSQRQREKLAVRKLIYVLKRKFQAAETGKSQCSDNENGSSPFNHDIIT